MQHPEITMSQLTEAMEEWRALWGESWTIKNGGNRTEFLLVFLKGVNSSTTCRQCWDRAKTHVLATCNHFPFPCDVIEAAERVKTARDVEVLERHEQNKRTFVPYDKRIDLSEITRQFTQEERD